MLIILTGPPGSGKSTIGEKLAYTFPHAINFSLDDIRHFVKGGYIEPWNDTEKGGQATLATDVAIDMIKHYLAKNFVVIIDDIIYDEGIKQYKEHFDDVHGFLLLPSAGVLHQRDKHRSPGKQMGERSDELYSEFSRKNYSLLDVVDNSNHTINQTVAYIKEKLNLL